MPLFNDHYEMLGIDPSATRDEIKRAYRRRALEAHPDLHQNPADSQTEEMRLLNEAYKILSHPLKRTGYDIDWNNYYRQRGMVSSRRPDSDPTGHSSGSASANPARTSTRFGAIDVFLLTALIVLSIVLGIMLAGRVRQRLVPGPTSFPPAPPPAFQGSAIRSFDQDEVFRGLDGETTFSVPDPSGSPLDV